MPVAKRYETIRKELDTKSLMEEARVITGLSDYGDMHFVEPMSRFMDRAAREVNFSAEGLDAFKALNLRFLVNRLRTQDDIRRHPEILKEDVSDPIIIIGLPRSGTTKLQRMLSAASDVQKLFMWRMLNPAPFPDAVPGQPDPRIAAAGMAGTMADGDETVQAAHAMAANEVDEEFVLFDFTCDPSVSGFSIYLPLFFHEDWIAGMERDADREAYRYVQTLLKYMQWQDGGKRGRPWIMKAVMHTPHMDALLECFPKATLVHCHRDPLSAIPSIAKLQWAGWTSRALVDKKFAGRGFLEWAAASMNRYLEARKRMQLDARILDVKYESIRDDIMPVIREIYRRARREPTTDAVAAMQQWERNNEQGKHGHHSYSLAEFGLTEEMINDALKEYIARFIDRR